MKTIVVIPTYNERNNIRDLIEQILNLKLNLEILIIDDNSPDGTGKIIDDLAKEHPEISVIHREAKLGIGSAYTLGFKISLDKDYDYILTMDADFSHSPRYLKEFIKAIQSCDIVVGSRYVKGGGIINWPLRRWVLSRCANFITKKLLNLEINDSTSGFRCYRNSVLCKIGLDKLTSDGYAFQIEILDRSRKLGFKIKETPIIFNERKQGSSKISRKEIMKVIWLFLRLKWNHRLASL